MIRLRRGPVVLDIVPHWGGGISRLTYDSVDMLRPPRGDPDDPQSLDLACFPLVPYANRIAQGRFGFGGRAVALRPNMDDQAHPLHGHGWLTAWRVEDSGDDFALLSFAHEADAWPWAYRAVQRLELTDTGIAIALTVTNMASEPAPVGLGFHPFFPDRASARLTASVDGIWDIDSEFLPTTHRRDLAIDWRQGAPMAQPSLVDHCHTGWNGVARIDLPGRGCGLRLGGSPALRWLHIYSPPGQDFFCVEPVSHRPDALNAPDSALQGIRTLDPGASLTVSMTLDVAVR